MVILSVDDCVCVFVLFVVWMRCPAQDATGGWVMPGYIQVVSFVYILTV